MLNDPQPDTWYKVIEVYKKAVEHGQTTLEKIAKSKILQIESIPTQYFYLLGFNSSEDELKESVNDHKVQAWITLRKKIDEELADTMLLLKLRSR